MRILAWKSFAFLTTSLLASCLSIGCGGVVTTSPTGSGGAGGGGAGGEGGKGGSTGTTMVLPPAITELRAPDRTSVRIKLSGDVQQIPTTPAAYVFTSEYGALPVKAVTWDAAAKTIVLETEKQKLGVEYTFAITAAGDALDGLGGKVLAADTATFWATDFAEFTPYEVEAERVGVGERVVLYLQPGLWAGDIEETIADFDKMIFPIETELFRAAPDRDKNGRIVLLGLDGKEYYGGYFNPVNALTEKLANQWNEHSNEMEILYINVASVGGFAPELIVSHEFEHLLYQEQHSFLVQSDDFPYHNEGLAECAVHAVYGSNDMAAAYYVQDPQGDLATGKSLVAWEYGNYSQYAQAYVFWTYIASQIGGASAYRDFFLSDGNPQAIQTILLEKLGVDFVETQLRALAATWAQAPDGPYGFKGMLQLPSTPATVPLGTTSVNLAPFAASFFPQTSNGIVAANAGPNVRFIGLGAGNQVDAAAPFDVAGGVVIAQNASMNWKNGAPEPSGDLGMKSAAAKVIPAAKGARDLGWLHAPPLPPTHKSKLTAWREQTRHL